MKPSNTAGVQGLTETVILVDWKVDSVDLIFFLSKKGNNKRNIKDYL